MDPFTILGLVGPLIGGLFGSQKQESSTTSQEENRDTKTRSLSEPAEAGLTNTLLSLLGGGLGDASAALKSSIAKDTSNPINFDRDAFVKGITDRARSETSDALESDLNDLFTKIGSGAGANSMAAILANKTRSAAAAKVAGIEQDATAQGVQIEEGLKTGVSTRANSNVQTFTNLLTSLIAGVKGASTTETSRATGKSTTNGSSSGSGFDGAAFGKLLTGVANVKY